MRLEMYRGGAQYRTSLIRIPFTLGAPSEDEEDNANTRSTAASSPAMDAPGVHPRQLRGDASPCGARVLVTAMSVTQNQPRAAAKGLALLQDAETEENDTVDMVELLQVGFTMITASAVWPWLLHYGSTVSSLRHSRIWN